MDKGTRQVRAYLLRNANLVHMSELDRQRFIDQAEVLQKMQYFRVTDTLTDDLCEISEDAIWEFFIDKLKMGRFEA